MNKTMIAAGALSALTLAACATGPGGNDPRERFYRSLAPRANPSALIATELAFAREAREEGQWTAFREYAAEDAVMFVPQAVNAQEWLADRDDPAQTVQWQPYEVWSSCDGSLSVTRGAWQRPDGTDGYFTTVWRRTERRRGEDEYRWVLDQSVPLDEPLAEPDIIRTTVADCGGDALMWTAPDPALAAKGTGRSNDGSLTYAWTVADDLSRTFTVSMLVDGEGEDVLTVAVPPPGGG